jgi:SAM-dependent methyltransferase
MATKLRIVQVESFYTHCLDDIYRNHAGLAGQRFADQVDALLDSGFSGGHNTVPSMNPQRWDTHYLIPNCRAAQSQWALEHGSDPQRSSLAHILEAQLRAIDPDVLYLSDIPGFDFSILERLPRRPFVVGWHASIVDARIPWHQIDLVLSGIRHIRESAVALGARAADTFMPAAPPYRNPMGTLAAPRHDLVFSGSFSGHIHHERAAQYRALSRQIGPREIALYTPGAFPLDPEDRIALFAPVFGRDVLELYARSRIVLDSRGDFQLPDQGARETSNMRIFEATRAGALLITEHCDNLTRYFQPGEEIITYHDTAELVEKVNFYLDPDNEALRHRIATAGLARVRRDHLLEHRAAWLEDILGNHLEHHLASGALTAPAPDTIVYRQVFCTTAGADDVLFVVHSVKMLQSAFPGQPITVLCKDETVRRLLRETTPGVTLTDLAHVLAPADQRALADNPALLPWVLPAQLLRTMMDAYPRAQRVTYVHPTVLVQDSRALTFDDSDRSTCLLDYGWVAPYLYEASVLGRSATDLLSVANDVPSRGLISQLANTAHDSNTAGEKRVASVLQASGVSVRLLRASTPWDYQPGAPNATGLFLFGLVQRVGRNNYQLLSFGPHPGWEQCYADVYLPVFGQLETMCVSLPALQGLPTQVLSNVDPGLATLLLRHHTLAQQGYRRLTAQEYAASHTSIEGWNTQAAAAAQDQAFHRLIDQFRADNRRADLLALQSILQKIQRPGMRLLETGCGSGYLHTFIDEFVEGTFSYAGIDLAPAMVDLARQTYPDRQFEVMSSSKLKFPDRAFNVVLNGASLMHTIEFDKAIHEAARVASDFAIFHTVTVLEAPENLYFTKNGYGSPVVEVCFSESVLSDLLARNHLQPVLVEKSIDYDLGQVFGTSTRSLSIACLRQDPHTTDGADGKNHYCAYFDSNYLTRAMLMVESLKRHDPLAHFHLLCLDKTAEDFLKHYAAHITTIGIDELQAADPEFAASKENRSLVEWYFTATSVLSHYLLRKFPAIPRLTYLDSDLFFYASPAILHAESVGRSVQIIEHRFSPHLQSMERYGRFNVAWISFFNTEEGRRVVADYRQDCIEWCYDRLEAERFADQKYLDRWPTRYPNCCVSRWIGADVAHWNVSQWELRYFNRQLYVDSEQLIFYHFQGIKLQDNGRHWAGSPPAHFGAYFDPLYAPYLAAMDAMESRLKDVLNGVSRKQIRYAQ